MHGKTARYQLGTMLSVPKLHRPGYGGAAAAPDAGIQRKHQYRRAGRWPSGGSMLEQRNEHFQSVGGMAIKAEDPMALGKERP